MRKRDPMLLMSLMILITAVAGGVVIMGMRKIDVEMSRRREAMAEYYRKVREQDAIDWNRVRRDFAELVNSHNWAD